MTAPALSQFQNGISQVSGDNLETFNQTCNVVADLRGFIGTAGMQVYLRGYTAINDGGQGQFYWNVAGTGPDDGGVTAIVPNGAAKGCWSRSSMISQQLLGTNTNNNALAGYVGEYISSYRTSPLTISSNTAVNITSISLTAGDWDVGFTANLIAANTKVANLFYACLNTVSATLNIADFGHATWQGSWTGEGISILALTGQARYSLASTTTVYLVGYATLTGDSTSTGGLWARRAR